MMLIGQEAVSLFTKNSSIMAMYKKLVVRSSDMLMKTTVAVMKSTCQQVSTFGRFFSIVCCKVTVVTDLSWAYKNLMSVDVQLVQGEYLEAR